jgi:ClpP class serine protease
MAIDPNKFKIDKKKASQAEIDEALALLEKKRVHQAKVEAGEIKGYAKTWAEMTPEQKAKAKKYTYRRTVRQSLMIAKAVAAGITVSDKEVDAELAKKVPKGPK